MSTDPQQANPNQVGYSLANVGELLTGCLDVAGARTVLEVGAYKGELTALLLDWASGSGATVAAVDPLPEPELLELAERRPDLELLRETSERPLRERELPDAVVLDGDHNHFTLSGELEAIAERAGDRPPPLLLFHDVGWPHARRDSYYAPERVPPERRQPLAHKTGLVPGNTGTDPDGLPFEWAAAEEGGPRNGVLTAIEDFMQERERLRLVRVPTFFGFGILWHEDAPYAAALGDLLGPFDGNPVIARLEANRVAHLTMVFRLAARIRRQEHELRLMLGSRAFGVAERVSRLRGRSDGPAFSRRRVEEALRDR